MKSEWQTFETHGVPVVCRSTGTPLVTVRLIINAGSIQETVPGTAHFLEHMFFKGSLRRGYEEMNRLVARLGNTNAYTSNERTVYYIDTTEDRALEALDLLLEMFFLPRMDPEEFEKERRVILEEYQAGEDDPVQFLLRNAGERVFNGVNGRPVIGTRESLNAITVEDLQAFRQAQHHPENMAIAIVGGRAMPTWNNVHQVTQAYAEHFKPSMGTRNVFQDTGLNLGTWKAPTTTKLVHPAEQAGLTLWMPWVTAEEDRELGYTSQIFSNMLGEGMHSLLFDRLREKSGLCYATGCFNMGVWNQTALVGFALLSPENLERALTEMQTIFEEVAAGKFEEDLLQVAKANNNFGLASSTETASRWAYQFVDNYFYYQKMKMVPYIFNGIDFYLDWMGPLTDAQIRENIQVLAQKVTAKAAVVVTNAPA